MAAPHVAQDAIVNEVKIMKLQHHKAVLPLYAAFLVEDQLWMVLPFVAGGSAQDILKRFKDGTVSKPRTFVRLRRLTRSVVRR